VKLTASTPAEQRRQLLLLGVLLVVAVVVWYTQFGSGAAETPVVASNAVTTPILPTPPPASKTPAGRPEAGGGLPEPIRLSELEPVAEQASGARNPFGFGAPPPPPRVDPPAAPPPPPPRPVTPQPTGPPPLPPIPVKFLGYVEDPKRPGKVVALGIGAEVVIAREGDLVDGRFRLLKVALETIVMAYPDGRGQQTIRLSGQ